MFSHFVAANNKHNFDVEIDGQLLRVTRGLTWIWQIYWFRTKIDLIIGFGDQNQENIHMLGEEIAYNSVSYLLSNWKLI